MENGNRWVVTSRTWGHLTANEVAWNNGMVSLTGVRRGVEDLGPRWYIPMSDVTRIVPPARGA